MTLKLELGVPSSSDAGWLFAIGAGEAPQDLDGLVRVDGFDAGDHVPEVVSVLDKARQYGAHFVFFEAGQNGRLASVHRREGLSPLALDHLWVRM